MKQINYGRIIDQNINVKQSKLTSFNARYHTIEEKGAN